MLVVLRVKDIPSGSPAGIIFYKNLGILISNSTCPLDLIQ